CPDYLSQLLVVCWSQILNLCFHFLVGTPSARHCYGSVCTFGPRSPAAFPDRGSCSHDPAESCFTLHLFPGHMARVTLVLRHIGSSTSCDLRDRRIGRCSRSSRSDTATLPTRAHRRSRSTSRW